MDEQQVRADERAKIAWWLRAAADGPVPPRLRLDNAVIRELADVIEQHPERFSGAPGVGGVVDVMDS